MKCFALLAVALVAATFTSDVLAEDEDPSVTVCEIAIKKSLKAPKSYERDSCAIVAHQVFITYDAVNEFNAPIRSSQSCEFFIDKGSAALVPLELRRLIRIAADIQKRTESLKDASDAKRLEQDALAAQLAMTTTMLRHAAISLEAANATTYPIPLLKTQVVPLKELPTLPK